VALTPYVAHVIAAWCGDGDAVLARTPPSTTLKSFGRPDGGRHSAHEFHRTPALWMRRAAKGGVLPTGTLLSATCAMGCRGVLEISRFHALRMSRRRSTSSGGAQRL
jgi:hypothetical protein